MSYAHATKATKICVSGSTGFIGRALVNLVENSEFQVVKLQRLGVDDKNSSKPIQEMWAQCILDEQPDVLFLCDWAGVADQRDDNTLQHQNVHRWKVLTQAAVQAGVSRIVALGSQAEISKDQEHVNEEVEFNPQSNYGEAKAKAFEEIRGLTLGTETRLLWARLFSVYGPNMSRGYLIPQAIDAFNKGTPFKVRNCDFVWNFLFYQDCVSALMKIATVENPFEIYNVASLESFSIKTFLEVLQSIMNRTELIKCSNSSNQDNRLAMRPSIDRLRSTGWAEVFSLERGLQTVVQSARLV